MADEKQPKKKISPKIKKRKKKAHRQRASSESKIVIHPGKEFSFDSEDELFKHFKADVDVFEGEFLKLRRDDDYSDEEAEKYFQYLDLVLDDPDEIWEDHKSLEGKVVHHYLRSIPTDNGPLYYIAVTFVAENMPTFIYLHFPTKFEDMVEQYRRGELIFDRVIKEVEKGAVEGDALGEGDELAVGLYKAMLKLRSPSDIPEDDFASFAPLREDCIQDADEIWRTTDYTGQVFVHFIREFSDFEGGEDLYYIVVTLEEASTNSHALLFSFPTKDTSLVERYRHGENLQADEVIQEASH
jgi:hypothetical protein